MIKLKDRIAILKSTTSNEDVMKIASLAEGNCKASEPLNTMIAEALVKDLEPFVDDNATAKFINREKRLNAINNLGVKETVRTIMESDLMHNMAVKNSINAFVPYLDHNPEYFLARPFMEQFKNVSWHKDVKAGFSKIEENLKKYEDDINLCSFIHEYSLSSGEYLMKTFIKEFDAYFIDRDEFSKKQLIEKIHPYLHDSMLRGLNEFLKMSDSAFQAYSDNVADIKNIYSPVIIKENEEIFFASGKFMKKTGNKLSLLKETEIKQLSKSFIDLALFVASPNVVIKENEITVYTANKEVKLIKEGENILIVLNKKQIPFNSFTRFFMNEGIFNVGDKDILGNIVNLYENFDNVYEIDYGKRISSKIYESQWVDVFKLGDSVYVSKVDGFNRKNDFYPGLNATQTRKLVLEHIGYDMSKSFRDLLPEEQTKLDEYKNTISEIDEAILILTSKKDEIIKEAAENPYLRNDNKIIELVNAVDAELTTLKEKKLVVKNIIEQFETVSIGIKPADYISEENEIDKFWKNGSNKNKKLYFAQEDEESDKYLVGSQTFEEYKDNFNWNIEDSGMSRDAAVKRAQDLAKNDSKGFYFETDDVKESVITEEELNEFKVEKIGKKGDEFVVSIEGHEYGYKPIAGGNLSIDDLEKKFDGIAKFSSGKALAWLKRNADLVSGSQNAKITALIQKFESMLTEEDLIPGGKAAGKTVDDIAVKHNVSVADINKELEVGKAVETEHVDTAEKAEEIAKDHLWENPKYYSDLVASGIVDEPEALKIAKDLLNVEPKTNESEGSKDPDGVKKLDDSSDDKKEHPSNETELQAGDKIKMKNGKFGVVASVNGSTSEVIVNMEDGKTVSVPKQFLHELEIVEKKSKESNPEVKISDGKQSVQIEEGSSEWIDAELTYGGKTKKIKVFALDYTSKSDNEDIRIKDERGKDGKAKKSDIKVAL